jgi:hypothetical protein
MARAAITAGLTAPFLAAATPAFASGGGGVSSSGACTNGGHFELKAKHDDGAIEIEHQVDSNRAGQVWAVRITDNGAVVVSRHATTAGPSGSLTVRKVIANRPGLDKIHARATFKNHTCEGAVTLRSAGLPTAGPGPVLGSGARSAASAV